MLLKEFVFGLIILIFVSTSSSASLLRFSKSNCWLADADVRGRYRGECKNDKANSKFISVGKLKYESEFVNDRFSGPGKYKWPGGAINESDLGHGRPNGRETHTKQTSAATYDNSGLNEKKLTLEVRADSKFLTNQAKRELFDFANTVATQPSATILIEGYTASNNNTVENFELSVHRANLVKELLIANGVDAGQINAVGRGIENPLAGNDTREGRRMNRRVEISINQ